MSSLTVEGLNIRDLTPSDYQRLCEIRNLSLVEPWTPELLLERDLNPPEGLVRIRLGGWVKGELVAVGLASRWPSMNGGLFYVSIDVLPSHKRKGIGSTLLREVELRMIEVGAASCVGAARDDRKEGEAFLTANDFEFQQHLFDSELKLDSFDEGIYADKKAKLEKEGIRIVRYSDWGDTPENRRALYESHNICDASTPGIEDWGLMTYEHFEKDLFDSRCDQEGMYVAFDEGRLVGMSMVAPVSDDGYGTHFTGVMPDWRGRGIGLVLKGLCVTRAKQAGATWVRAQNDKRNVEMLAVNGRLGFVPQFGWVHMKKRLGDG